MFKFSTSYIRCLPGTIVYFFEVFSLRNDNTEINE